MLASPFDAEDALQETLLRAWRALPRFRGHARLDIQPPSTSARKRVKEREIVFVSARAGPIAGPFERRDLIPARGECRANHEPSAAGRVFGPIEDPPALLVAHDDEEDRPIGEATTAGDLATRVPGAAGSPVSSGVCEGAGDDRLDVSP
jgi:hypothetical protein